MGSNITPLLLQITLNLLKNIDLKLQSSKAEERLSPLLWKNFAPEVWQKKIHMQTPSPSLLHTMMVE